MKKEYRLLKNEDFKKVLDKRQSVSRENFIVYHLKSELPTCRVGISVSSKVGNSVVRHKIKRQIDSMIQQLVDVNSPLDIVVIVRKKYLNNSYSDNFDSLKNVIKFILKKEKQYNEE